MCRLCLCLGTLLLACRFQKFLILGCFIGFLSSSSNGTTSSRGEKNRRKAHVFAVPCSSPVEKDRRDRHLLNFLNVAASGDERIHSRSRYGHGVVERAAMAFGHWRNFGWHVCRWRVVVWQRMLVGENGMADARRASRWPNEATGRAEQSWVDSATRAASRVFRPTSASRRKMRPWRVQRVGSDSAEIDFLNFFIKNKFKTTTIKNLIFLFY